MSRISYKALYDALDVSSFKLGLPSKLFIK
jgi:hypothetical protein